MEREGMMQIEMTEGQAGNVIVALGEVPALRDQLAETLRELEEAEKWRKCAESNELILHCDVKKCRQRIDKIAKSLSERDDCDDRPGSPIHASLEDMMTHYFVGIDQEKKEAAYYKTQVEDITALLRKRKDYPDTLNGTALMFKVKHFLKELDAQRKELKSWEEMERRLSELFASRDDLPPRWNRAGLEDRVDYFLHKLDKLKKQLKKKKGKA
jgi:hypothetical protein